jgi:4-diphosphocytidyl-2-C-methyl-D-erythritol kinase
MKSYCKINLFLHILGKNSNNYHNLESIFYFPEIYDEIFFDKKSSANNLVIEGNFAHSLENGKKDNIILKTYSLLRILFSNKVPELSFRLIKNLPVASGIGGGSSNSATILKLLNQEFELNLSKSQLYKIGTRIGADVPPCILSKTCFAEGIGDIITPIDDFPKLNILLINPLKQVNTADIFKMGFEEYNKPIKTNFQFKTTQSLIDFLENTENKLQANAIKICPEIEILIKATSQLNGCLISRMSGSGATVFAIFDSKDNSLLAAQELKRIFPNYWIATG